MRWGSCASGSITSLTLAGSTGTPQAIANGDTITIASGSSNLTASAGATDTITIGIVNNPTFTTSVTTPSLTSTAALGITGGTTLTLASTGAGNDIIINGADIFDVQDATTFASTVTLNGTTTANANVDLTFAGTENLAVTSDLAGTANLISVIGTPSASAGTTRGLLLQQADSANTNGLDTALLINNADTDLAVTTGIQFTSSGGGFTNFIDTPTINLTGTGAVTGATGVTSSGTITFQG